MYNAVGIDASKFKSTVTVIQPAGIVIRKPFDVPHTSNELNTLVTYLKSLEGETRAVIECTGRYHDLLSSLWKTLAYLYPPSILN